MYYKVLQSTTPYWKVLHEMSLTLSRATGIIVQPHQILCLPQEMILMIDLCRIWNVIYNARSNRCHCPTSPNIPPATKKGSHDCPLSHMRRQLQFAEQQVSLSNLTKYCAYHEKWFSWLILVTYETSFTMRGATGVIVQAHQILCLPQKMILMIDPRHIRNVIYIARSNRRRPPTSPNTALATKNDMPKSEKNLLKTSWSVIYNARPIRPWSEHDPTLQSGTRRATEVTFRARHEHFYWKIHHFALRLSFQIS